MEISKVYQIMFGAIKSGGVEAVISGAYSIYGLPIAVTDASFRMIVPNHPPVAQGDDVWDRPLKEMKVPLDIVQTFQQNNVIEKVCENPDKPIYLDWGPFENSPRVTTVIMVKGAVEGYIAVLCPRSEFKEWHIPALAVVADAVGIALQKEQALIRNSNVLVESFSRDLFSGVLVSHPGDLEKWLEVTGLDLRPEFMVIAVKARDKKQAALQSYMQNQLINKQLPLLSYPKDNCLCLLVYHRKGKDDFYKALKEIFTLAKSLEAVCGVSRRFNNLPDTGIFCEQAVLALATGQRLNIKRQIFGYNQMALYAMLIKIYEGMDSGNCIHPAVFTLEDYDKVHGTEYLKTLTILLTSMFNTAFACGKLHIHRNTLLYRMNKIKELTGCNLQCERTNAGLFLGIHLKAVIEKIEKPITKNKLIDTK